MIAVRTSANQQEIAGQNRKFPMQYLVEQIVDQLDECLDNNEADNLADEKNK